MTRARTFKPRRRPIDLRIDKYRRFERFFEQRVRTAKLVAWPNECSVTSLMLLQELAVPGRSACATAIAAKLRLDLSYVARELKMLCAFEYATKMISSRDARLRVYSLTAAGQDLARRLERSHRDMVHRILDPIPESRQKLLVRAMATIQRVLSHTDQQNLLDRIKEGR